MANGIRWVGLDVHAAQTAGAVFDSATGEVRSRMLPGRPHEVMPWLLELPRPVRLRGGADRLWAGAPRPGGRHRHAGLRAGNDLQDPGRPREDR